MPGTIKRLKGGKVRATWGGRVVARRTTVKKAKAQRRLLQAVKHNPKFRARRRRR